MPKLFQTGNSETESKVTVGLELPDLAWFKAAFIMALSLMCNEENWTEQGDATVSYARDKSAEILETLDFKMTSGVPIGSTLLWMFASPPAKWLILNGQAVSKTTYPELFALLGYTYGGGFDMFVLPTMNDYLPIGASGSVALGQTGGSNFVNILQANLPAVSFPVTDPGHVHTVTDPGHDHAYQSVGTSGGDRAINSGGSNLVNSNKTTGAKVTGISVNSGNTGISVNSGGSGSSLTIRPASRAFNYIIYAGH